MTVLPLASTGNRAHSLAVRGEDLYETHPVAVRALLHHIDVPDVVWEPACGPGAIVTELRRSGRTVIATDLVDYGLEDAAGGLDFLCAASLPRHDIGMIVTNPPFKHASAFVDRALGLCPRVAMLLRIGFLAGLRWMEPDAVPPRVRNRALSFKRHLNSAYIFTPRLPMMHRAGFLGTKSTSQMDFAWLVFERDCNDRSDNRSSVVIDWVDWRRFADE